MKERHRHAAAKQTAALQFTTGDPTTGGREQPPESILRITARKQRMHACIPDR